MADDANGKPRRLWRGDDAAASNGAATSATSATPPTVAETVAHTKAEVTVKASASSAKSAAAPSAAPAPASAPGAAPPNPPTGGAASGAAPSGVSNRTVEAEMRKSFLDYAMSVIVSRALPDARDGLKPVHRRILYAMHELSLSPDRGYRKSALVVGDVLGKYHPHGDSAVYEAMVRMAQDWNLRYPLVDGQGNFGSVDGDSAAAMRYTEARLTRPAMPILNDLDKETVPFVNNYDASLKEPEVMPAAFPNLLVNGSAGIAVGMATNVPPHNLQEIVDAAVRLIENPAADTMALMEFVRGPDFPTGGIIQGRSGILNYLTTGRGKIVVRGKYEVEEMQGDRERVVFTEIPYQINKAELLIKIADLVKDKVVEGISDLRDESSRQGMRLVIELKRDAIPDVVLNQLWKHTELQSTFAVNNLALVEGRPKTLGLRELLEVFLKHRFVVVTRRTQFELKKAAARAHILEGLLIAMANIDAVVALIRASRDGEAALIALKARFGLSDEQGKAILDMRLQKLTSLETDSIKTEHTELTKLIADLKDILATPARVYAIIKAELLEAKKNFGDQRRTQVSESDGDIDDESLIPVEESVYLLTQEQYLKRMPLATWREQNRGGKGLRGMKTKEEDQVIESTVGSTHDWLCFFTNQGRIHRLKGYRVPTGTRQHKGKPVVNLLQLEPNEIVETIIPITDFEAPDQFLFFATKKGVVKRTEVADYKNLRNVGIIAVDLRDGDELLAVRRTDGRSEAILATKLGQACRFDESEVRSMGRQAAGVRGITLEDNDEVVSLAIAEANTSLVSVTTNGYGKRTELEEYRKTHRGGKGVRTIVVNERNGSVVAVRTVRAGESLLMLTKSGMGVRIPVDQLRTMGRSTQGVTLMDVDDDDSVTQVAVLPPSDDDAVPPGDAEGAPPGDEGAAPPAGAEPKDAS
jgi:DNA gyrase subunit A